jgi:hypothetical protein
MASPRALARLEALIWVLIYSGLFGVVLGIVTNDAAPALAWSLGVTGACICAVGIVLIWVRSRLTDDR